MQRTAHLERIFEPPEIQSPTSHPDARRPPDDRAPRDRQSTAISLVVLVVLGGILRFWALGASRFNYDESFTAMAGRLPLGHLFEFLRAHDSHPPLDYLLHAPLARAGVSEAWFRTPSALLSLGALALFAWWMRSHGRVGVLATALMAVSTFQVVHGREARMYAELELLGVAVAVLATTWITKPRRWHAPALGALVFLGLLTHVSMFLLAAGLLVLAGRRTDSDAWRWRGAIGLAGLGWLLLWGSTFVTQAGGGHSAWIPRTTLVGLGNAVGRLVAFGPGLALAAAAATIVGGALLLRRMPALGRVWICCFAVPIGLAALAGFLEPVVLDRTFTLMAWAPCLAVAVLLDGLVARRRVLGAGVFVAMLLVIVPVTVDAIQTRTGPDTPLRELARLARPGDVLAVRPVSKAPEIAWALGVRSGAPIRRVTLPGAPRAFAFRVGTGAPSGRIWLLDWHSFPDAGVFAGPQCAPRWSWGATHIRCLEAP